MLGKGLSTILNIHMLDKQCLQASIPMKSSGVGIWHATLLALFAFLTSAVAMSDLQSIIISSGVQNVGKEVELAQSLLCVLTTTPPHVSPVQVSQRAWDAQVVAQDLQPLVVNATSDVDKARLLAMKADHGSEWIFSFSKPMVFALVTRPLGPHSCPCDGAVDAKGLHELSYHASAVPVTPYDIKNSTCLACSSQSKHSISQKPSSLLPSENKHRDRLTLVP